MARSLKKKSTTETFRCRKCGLPKKGDEFYKCTDIELDSNGKLSICKNCCRELFEKELYSGIEKALLSICRRLNIAYNEVAVEKTRAKMEELKLAEKPLDILFGTYLQAIHTRKTLDADLTFREPSEPIVVKEETIEVDPQLQKLQKEWGKGLKIDDYGFLEEELANWESTHRSDTMAEKTLLHHIAYKQLEIRNARLLDPPDPELSRAYLKELQDLMRTAAIDPNKANAAGQGKGKESFSAFIKMIEETEPADYYLDKGLFKDFDNIEFYFEKYITRPLKNFVMGSRDFNVETEKEGDDEDDSFDISDMGIEDDVPVAKEEEIKKEE
jgi:hypothetical protein